MESAYYYQTEPQKRTNLYRTRGRGNSLNRREVRMGSISLFTFPVANQEYTIETAQNTSKGSPFRLNLNIDYGHQINITDAGRSVLKVINVAGKIRQDEVFMRFSSSFEENNMSEVEREFYTPLFKQMADKLKALPVESEHVTIGRQDGTVTFYLYLGKNLLLTVSKAVSQLATDDVMFSVSLKKKVMVVDRLPVDELITCIEKTYSELA